LIAAKKPENMVRLYFGAVRVAACVQWKDGKRPTNAFSTIVNIVGDIWDTWPL
jgi:hypothetical protein